MIASLHVIEQPARFLEDLKLDEICHFGGFAMTEEEIMTFAECYDPRPVHFDRDAAAKTIFGGIIASSLQTLSASFGVFVRATVNLDFRTGLQMLETESPLPVRPDQLLSVRGRFLNVRPSMSKPAVGIVTFAGEAVNETQEVVLRFGTIMMLGRRPETTM